MNDKAIKKQRGDINGCRPSFSCRGQHGVFTVRVDSYFTRVLWPSVILMPRAGVVMRWP